jgi:hypothetical protein
VPPSVTKISLNASSSIASTCSSHGLFLYPVEAPFCPYKVPYECSTGNGNDERTNAVWSYHSNTLATFHGASMLVWSIEHAGISGAFDGCINAVIRIEDGEILSAGNLSFFTLLLDSN